MSETSPSSKCENGSEPCVAENPFEFHMRGAPLDAST